MSDTNIDNLLDKVYGVGVWVTQQRALGKPVGVKTSDTLFEAKSALYELMLSVIGDDDKLTHNVDTVEWIKNERNQLRQEQRNKLKELMK